MISGRVNSILKPFYKRLAWNCRFCSTIPQPDDRDPTGLFFDQNVQQLLITLSRMDYRKIFAARKDGTPLKVPQFKFMTEEELQEVRSQIAMKARGRMQMPPVVKAKSDETEVLSKDPALQGYETYNFVFTDISFGSKNRDRLIVVREPNGTLRHATCNERHRMNQIYFPMHAREIHTPKMFNDPYLSDLLDRGEFEFILDRACVQFEPDDPEYHRVTKHVYSYVNKLRKFDALRSTRHFGPLAFHLAWEKNVDTLLIDLIKSGNIEEAGALIRLYHRIHPETKPVAESMQHDTDLIRLYAKLDSQQRLGIMRALHAYDESRKNVQELEENIKKAHGFIEPKDDEGRTT